MEFLNKLKFDNKGLIPAIIQDEKTGEILMVGYMNKKSLVRTIKEGKTCFWSRSKHKFWVKGEISGHCQKVKEIFVDCDGDSLLVKVEQIGGACHTGYYSCFYRKLTKNGKFKIVGEKVFEPEKIYKK